MAIGLAIAQNDHADGDQDKGEQRSEGGQVTRYTARYKGGK